MVDPLQLSSDIAGTVLSVATGPLLWLFLFLLAWGEPALAQRAGFGRRTFWILLPLALAVTLANLPIFGWAGNGLSVNFAGGLLPLLVSFVALRAVFPDRAPLLAVLLSAFAAASGGELIAVYLLPEGTPLSLAVVAVAAATPVAVLAASRLVGPTAGRTWARAALLLAFAEAAVAGTFLTTQTVPGVGIVSQFPEYLLTPLLVGVVAAIVLSRLPEGEPAALAGAYATITFGVLIGADLLRQPPLYGGGTPENYAIGGAATGDLLYLSGLLGLVGAYATLRLLRVRWGPRPTTVPLAADEERTAGQWLRRALLDAVRGSPGASLQQSERAVHVAFAETRRLLRLPPAAVPEQELEGLPVPAWVRADRRNLSALAARGPSMPYDATRGWLTARWLVRFARMMGLQRLARRGPRIAAFAVDLALPTVPAVLVWYLLAAMLPGTPLEVLGSVPVNLAVFGYVSFAVVLYALGEALYGRTLGKRLLGLAVTDRHLAPPSPMAAFVRNLPKAIPLALIGEFGVIMTVLVARGTPFSVTAGGLFATVASLVTLGIVLGLALLLVAVFSCATIGLSPERQRLGDLWAGTWVVRVTPASVRPTEPWATATFG